MDHNTVRAMFAQGDDERDAGLKEPEGIVRCNDISYGPHGKWNLLDVYRPQKAGDGLLPVIVSVHGGGLVYGDKERYQYYCMDLALRGFAVVNFNYRLAPEDPFPAAVEDVNRVFCWLADRAGEYGMDLDRLYTVGDSAGGQLSSQYLAMLTNPEFAKLYEFKLPSDKIRVRAAAFNCGHFYYEAKDEMNPMRGGVSHRLFRPELAGKTASGGYVEVYHARLPALIRHDGPIRFSEGAGAGNVPAS